MKQLLIVFHSKTGKNEKMSRQVYEGALAAQAENVEVAILKAADAGPQNLLDADALVFGTPENFGYMSGALKDFFDRTFYEVEGQVQGKPYCLTIGTGNDGLGAISSIRRICNGYNFREVQEPILVRGALQQADLNQCHELGMALAAGLDAGIF